MPVWAVTDTGAGLMLVHHNRKSDGKDFTGSRGSGGLPAFCETLIEFRRATEESKDRKRLLTGGGRYRETPDKLLIELTPAGYVSHGDPDDMTPDQKVVFGVGNTKDKQDWMRAAAAFMPDDLMKSVTYGEIQAHLKGAVGHGVRREDLLNWLAERVRDGTCQRIGQGTKASPHRWAKAVRLEREESDDGNTAAAA